MQISSFHEPGTGTWTYLLSDPIDKVAAIIDPVLEFDPVSGLTDTGFIDPIIARAHESGCRIAWVLETHAHADHLSAAGVIREKTGARIACGKGICEVQENFSRVFNMKDMLTDGSQFDRLLVEGDEIDLGRLTIRVMETPGHTDDSITYLVGDVAFIGDTLFSPGFGTARCDFPGGDAAKLYESIRSLYELPRGTRLFLCHDYPESGEQPVRDITVETSRRDNIHLTADTTKEQFVNMRRQRDGRLGLPRLILPSLQVNILGGNPPEPDDNGVSYLQIPFNRSITDLIKGEIK
jgi:glyoxylase-like metal-dependent hydrolase (beta-lactamase superfamily II)